MSKVELQKMKDDLAYIKKVLAGNGEDGLIKQVQKQTETLIEMKSFNHLKVWILAGSLAFFMSVCAFLLALIFKLPIGG